MQRKQSSRSLLLGRENDVQSLWKRVLDTSQKFNAEPLCEAAVLLLGIHRELKAKTQIYLCTYVQHSVILTRQHTHTHTEIHFSIHG